MGKALDLIKLTENEDYMSMDNPGEAIKKDYDVDEDGIIQDPGKFEGEGYWVPYFYDLYMNGSYDEEGESWAWYKLDAEDFKKFPELEGSKSITIYFSDQGFISGDLSDLEDPPEEEPEYEED